MNRPFILLSTSVTGDERVTARKHDPLISFSITFITARRVSVDYWTEYSQSWCLNVERLKKQFDVRTVGDVSVCRQI